MVRRRLSSRADASKIYETHSFGHLSFNGTANLGISVRSDLISAAPFDSSIETGWGPARLAFPD